MADILCVCVAVTPRMGYILMQLATAYDNAYQAALS